MNNRLKKLQNEEDRLRKQIMLAHKHSDFADKISSRRQEDFENKTTYDGYIENNRLMQNELNNMRA